HLLEKCKKMRWQLVMPTIGGDGVRETLLQYLPHQKMSMKVDNRGLIHHPLLSKLHTCQRLFFEIITAVSLPENAKSKFREVRSKRSCARSPCPLCANSGSTHSPSIINIAGISPNAPPNSYLRQPGLAKTQEISLSVRRTTKWPSARGVAHSAV